MKPKHICTGKCYPQEKPEKELKIDIEDSQTTNQRLKYSLSAPTDTPKEDSCGADYVCCAYHASNYTPNQTWEERDNSYLLSRIKQLCVRLGEMKVVNENIPNELDMDISIIEEELRKRLEYYPYQQMVDNRKQARQDLIEEIEKWAEKKEGLIDADYFRDFLNSLT